MGTALGPRYIPYTYMDPLGMEIIIFWGLYSGPPVFEETTILLGIIKG